MSENKSKNMLDSNMEAVESSGGSVDADRLARATLLFMKEGYYLDGSDREPRIRAEFDAVHNKKLVGEPLSDADMALLFVEAVTSEERFQYFDAPFQPAAAPEHAKRVLLISLSNMGDVICSSVVFEGLRRMYPSSRIVFLTETPSGALFERCADIDLVIAYSRKGIIEEYNENHSPENLESARGRFLKLLDELRAENFDAVFNLHPSARSALIAGALDVPPADRIGYIVGRDGMPVVRGNIWMRARLSGKIMATRVPEEINIRMLGLAPLKRKVCIGIPEDGGPWACSPIPGRPARARTIGVNPFASVPEREWGEKKFIELCHILSRDMDCDLIVFAGPGRREKEGAARICGEIGPGAIPFAGAPPDQAAFVSRRCDLFVTNDTGPMHFAGAAGVRCLVIQGPTNILPYSSIGHIGVAAYLKCAGCSPFPKCKNLECFDMIKPEHVALVAAAMLEHGPLGALSKLAGSRGDGKFPHGLITTGAYESITPRYLIRLRSAFPLESNIVAEWTRIATLNAMLLIEAGALETERHPLGTDHPGLAAPIAPETALRETLRRYSFVELDSARIKQTIEEVLDLLGSGVESLQPENILLLLPIAALRLFLSSSGLSLLCPRVNAVCSNFLSTLRQLIPG
jgi:heptosyltransferase I